MPTSCKEAIKKWEEKTGQNAAEAKEVALFCQIPFIERMDEALNTLEACEKLSLSTNDIERIGPLPKLKNLKILSLARNKIRRITSLDEIGNSLEQLWLSYNLIEKLEGLQPCIKLEVLYMSNNKVKSWEEVAKLAQLSKLTKLLLFGNTVYQERSKDEMAPHVIKRVPHVSELDGKSVTAAVRKAADDLD